MEKKHKEIILSILFILFGAFILMAYFVIIEQRKDIGYYEEIVYKQCDLINTYRDLVIELEPNTQYTLHPALDCKEFILKM